MIRIRIFTVLGILATALYLGGAPASARMPLPPVKIPAPTHTTNLTKQDILATGGTCAQSGGGCTDSHGRSWDCSDPEHCEPIKSGV